jgi:hypothetical protein
MEIAIIGTGFIASVLGGALGRSGHKVTFGSRDPSSADLKVDAPASVASVADAVAGAEVIILALPGQAVDQLALEYGAVLEGKLVIDSTNRMGHAVSNSRAALPSGVRYVRAFNTLGGENMAEPVFADGRADMFFSAPEADRPTVEMVIEGVGLRPVYVGEDEEGLIDSLFQLWIALAMRQGRGRRLAFRLLEG